MENIQDWATYLLNTDHAAAYQAYSTYSPYLSKAYSLINTARSYLILLLNQISQKPDLATIALLLVIVLVSLKILDILWQTLMFWFRLARRALFWGGLVMLGLWVYARGVEGVVEDVGFWQEKWGQEYGYWKERERVARMVRQGERNFGARQRQGW